MNKKTLGVLAILGASVMWALDLIFIKLAYEDATALQTMTTRALGILLVGIVYVFMTNKGNFKVTKKEAAAALLSGFLGSFIASMIYLYALETTPIVIVSFLGHLQPLFVVIMAHMFLSHEKLSRGEKIGFVLMVVASLLVTTKTLENIVALKFGTLADGLMLIAAILWGSTIIFARKYLMEVNAGVVAFYRFMVVIVLLLPYMLLTKQFAILNIYQLLVGITTGIGLVLWYEGAKHVRGAAISALELATVFFAGILGFVVLGESVSMMQIIGMIMLVVGVLFISQDDVA